MAGTRRSRRSCKRADREIGDFATFLEVLAERREAFKRLGATATDHAATSADTTRLEHTEAARLFAAALAGEIAAPDAPPLRGAHAERVRTDEP